MIDKEEAKEKVRARIIEIREALKLTKYRMAKEVGVTGALWGSWEKGQYVPNAANYLMIESLYEELKDEGYVSEEKAEEIGQAAE